MRETVPHLKYISEENAKEADKEDFLRKGKEQLNRYLEEGLFIKNGWISFKKLIHSFCVFLDISLILAFLYSKMYTKIGE